MSEHEDLLHRYEAAPARLRQVVAALPAGAMDRDPGEGEWTARQIVCHLADSEMMGGVRFRLLLAQEDPTFPLYEQARWAEALEYSRADAAAVDQAIELFAQLRAASSRLLRQASPERWDASGLHPERGRM